MPAGLELDWDFAGGSVLFSASTLTVVDSGPSLFWSEETRTHKDNKLWMFVCS